MKLLTRRALSLAIIFTLIITSVCWTGTGMKTEAASKKKYVVVLDPGHDSWHIGARYGKLREERLTLQIAKYCKKELEKNPRIKVYMTRTGYGCGSYSPFKTWCLRARPKYAKKKKANLFVSLHLNAASNKSARGAEVYATQMYAGKSVGKKSKKAAKYVLKELVKLGLPNRGFKRANHCVTKYANKYKIPATLIEHCFISNKKDQKKFLKTKAGLKKLGRADALGIAHYFGLKLDNEETIQNGNNNSNNNNNTDQNTDSNTGEENGENQEDNTDTTSGSVAKKSVILPKKIQLPDSGGSGSPGAPPL